MCESEVLVINEIYEIPLTKLCNTFTDFHNKLSISDLIIVGNNDNILLELATTLPINVLIADDLNTARTLLKGSHSIVFIPFTEKVDRLTVTKFVKTLKLEGYTTTSFEICDKETTT